MGKNTLVVIIVILLIILLLGAIGYILYDKLSVYQNQKQISAYQLGAQYGYQQAIIQLMQNAATCQQVPVTYNNQTINIVAVECLRQAQTQNQYQTQGQTNFSG